MADAEALDVNVLIDQINTKLQSNLDTFNISYFVSEEDKKSKRCKNSKSREIEG